MEAMSGFTFKRVSMEAMAVKIVIPAEAPSLGTAPAGRWMCTSILVRKSSGKPSSAARVRTKVNAAVADSFMIEPI